MNYRPDPKSWCLWDTWMFPDPDGERMHFFFLANRPDGGWEWAGHYLSEDLLHWQEGPAVRVCSDQDSYDARWIGTGMVFQGPADEYLLSYTANLNTISKISFLHSKDLMHWEKRWPEPCIESQLPYYQPDPKKSPGLVAFRDGFVHKVGNNYEALICAQGTENEPMDSGVIARYRSKGDDLQNWEALPPLLSGGIGLMAEVPEAFQIGDKHYLLWSNASHVGVVLDTTSRRLAFGTFYAVADSYEGPYVIPQDNLLIGNGDSVRGQSYVGRITNWQGQTLLYNHQCHPEPCLGLPKTIVQEPDGSLQAGYWTGIEKLHVRSLDVDFQKFTELTEVPCGQWDRIDQNSLKGSNNLHGSQILLDEQMPNDLHIRCNVSVEAAARWAITFRDGPEYYQKIKGLALQADFKHGHWLLGETAHYMTSCVNPIERIYQTPGQSCRVDILVRDIYCEIYIDGFWKFTFSAPNHRRDGQIGFLIDSGTVTFESIEIWQLEAMEYPYLPGPEVPCRLT